MKAIRDGWVTLYAADKPDEQPQSAHEPTESERIQQKLDALREQHEAEQRAKREAEKARILEQFDANLARSRAERERPEKERVAKMLDELNARAAALREAERAQRKGHALSAWLAEGGEPEAFESAWPEIEKRLLVDAALAGRGNYWRPTSL